MIVLEKMQWHTTFMDRNPSTDNLAVFHWIETEIGEFQAYDNDGEECLVLLPKEIQGNGVWTKNLADAKEVVELIRSLHKIRWWHPLGA